MRDVRLAVIFAIGFASQYVYGQSAENEASADVAFKEGLALRDAGKVPEACAKFESARDLDATSGTLLVLGDCYERMGRSASAFGSFGQAMILAGRENRPERADEARRRQDALAPKLPKLTIVVPIASNRPGLKIMRDNQEISAAALASALILDEGDHVIAASAPGYEGWSTHLTVAGGETRVEVPGLVRVEQEPQKLVDPPPSNAALVVPDVAPPPVAVIKQPDESTGGGARRATGIVLFVGGLGAIGTGAYFGYSAQQDWNSSHGHCDSQTSCDQRGVDLVNSAHQSARIADITVGAGVAAAAVGLYLWLSAPSSPTSSSTALRITPTLRTDGFAAALSGEF